MSKWRRQRARRPGKPAAVEPRQDLLRVVPLRKAEHEMPCLAAEHDMAARRERQADAEGEHQAKVVTGVVGGIENHLVWKAAVDFLIGKLAHFGVLVGA